jgi:serine/threonine protein kinase
VFTTNVPTVEHPKFANLHDLVKALNPPIFEEYRPTWAKGPDDDDKWYGVHCELWQAVDLLKHTLALDCTKRITATDALEHPFLKQEVYEDDDYIGSD